MSANTTIKWAVGSFSGLFPKGLLEKDQEVNMIKGNSVREPGTSSRVAARVGAKLEKALLAYTGAATAAGVGLLALNQAAEGRVIFKKVNKPISFNTILPLDLNHDGRVDFTFVDSQGNTSYGGWGNLTIFPNYRPNKIMGPESTWFIRFASALPRGVAIGSKGVFPPGAKVLAWAAYAGAARPASPSSCVGPWRNVTNRFLGLKFNINGKAHYGWARLDVSCGDTWVTGTLTGYAYETVANKTILSGQKQDSSTTPEAESGGLGRLARGASVISRLRPK